MYIDIGNPVERTASAYDFPLLIKQLWITPLAHNPEQEIVYRGHRRFRYHETYARLGRLASALSAIGVKPGMTVAVMDWDSHRYFECFFAIPMMGCVLQTVNVRLSPEQVLYTLNHAGADVILVNVEFLPLLADIRDRLEKDVRFVLMRDDGAAQPVSDLGAVGEYEALLAAASADYDFPDFDENTRATTFYTSGTTGRLKGCYFSHRQLVLHTLCVASWFGTAPVHGRIHREDVYMPMTPMFHVHAWGMPYVATLLGLKQVYPGRYEAGALLNMIRDEGVTLTHCVPSILHMLLTHPDSMETDLSRLKMSVGGSAMPQGLCRMALERGMDVIAGYGMSETAPIQTGANLSSIELAGDIDSQTALRVLAGQSLPLCDVRIVDADMHPQPHDGHSPGEVVFRSPWLTQGYFKEPENSEELWKGGYLHSGDIGTIDSHGRLQVRDRIKDMIKSGGEWISSLTLEDLTSQCPGVGEAAVIGIADQKWGERPLVLVVPRAGTTLDPEAIRQYLADLARKGTIPKYAVPDRVLVVESLAKTSVGKLDKNALRKSYREAG
ncbi:MULTISPECIES: fatty acid--CoA ligase [Rhodanobacter]|uniref:fatty acid--CoA ligase n=1 Tax=Rhodanobacter TaxID=75309 RepID=UPI00040A804A|nr:MULTISPECIES: fatty acid--CoA ligase [Rhodanobacter]UJJ53450.1 fatty acid--CoA ligase [Rhodanobacter thiooxydans]